MLCREVLPILGIRMRNDVGRDEQSRPNSRFASRVSPKENGRPSPSYCQTPAKRIDNCGQRQTLIEHAPHHNDVKDVCGLSWIGLYLAVAQKVAIVM